MFLRRGKVGRREAGDGEGLRAEQWTMAKGFVYGCDGEGLRAGRGNVIIVEGRRKGEDG